MVQFRSFTSGAAPAAPKINPLVEALLRRALSDRPIRQPLQGVDRLGKAALAVFLQRKEGNEERDRQERRTADIKDALTKGFGSPAQTFDPEVASRSPDVPSREGFITPAIPPDKQAFIRALVGSQDPGLQQSALVALLQGDTGGGFNLSQGQSRFDQGGNVIASLPAGDKLLSEEEEAQKIRIANASRSPGGVTPAQSANNAEIDAARSRLLALRLELQPGQTLRNLIISRTQRADDTGLGNPDFSTLISSALRIASNRKVGDDPGFNEFFEQLDFAPPLPPPEIAPEPEPEGPGFLSRTFDSLFGSDDAAAGLPPAGSLAESLNTPAERSRGGRFPQRGGGRSGIDALATSGTGVQAQPRARGQRVRGPRSAAAAKSISQMNIRELTDLLDQRGETLAPAKRQEVDARLRALGL